jgi:hypothetical protein
MLLLMAEVKRAAGDLPGALAATEVAAQRARALGVPALYRLDFLRGDILARSDRPPRRPRHIAARIANFPQNVQAYANLAIIYYIEGRRADVDRLFEQMVAANPTPAPTPPPRGPWTASARRRPRRAGASGRIDPSHSSPSSLARWWGGCERKLPHTHPPFASNDTHHESAPHPPAAPSPHRGEAAVGRRLPIDDSRERHG